MSFEEQIMSTWSKEAEASGDEIRIAILFDEIKGSITGSILSTITMSRKKKTCKIKLSVVSDLGMRNSTGPLPPTDA